MTTEFTWNLVYDGDEIEFEAPTKEKLIEDAQEWWATRWQDHRMANGEVRQDDAWAVALTEDGTKLQAHKFLLHYEHYHGDWKEHNTMHFGGSGSL